MSTARVLAAAYQLGEHAVPATEIPELAGASALRDFLISDDGGFVTLRCTDAPVLELMMAAAQKALTRADVPPDTVDAILIVTDSLPTGRAAHDEVRELVTELALTAATPMTLALLDCAAPIVALSAAAAMVAHGRYRTVLVLTGDVAELAAQGSRVVAGGSALASDAASAVLIGSRGPGRAVLGAASDYSHELAVDDLPSHRQLRLRVAAQRRLHGRLRETVGPAWRRPDLVLASNIARRLLLTYLDDVGYREDDIFLDNVAAHGHCLGSDPIINLVDAEVARPGDLDTCLLMGAGVAHSALLLLGGEDDA